MQEYHEKDRNISTEYQILTWLLTSEFPTLVKSSYIAEPGRLPHILHLETVVFRMSVKKSYVHGLLALQLMVELW